MTGPRSNGGPPSLISALRARHPSSGVMAWGRSVDRSRVVAAIVIAGLVLPAGCSGGGALPGPVVEGTGGIGATLLPAVLASCAP